MGRLDPGRELVGVRGTAGVHQLAFVTCSSLQHFAGSRSTGLLTRSQRACVLVSSYPSGCLTSDRPAWGPTVWTLPRVYAPEQKLQ